MTTSSALLSPYHS